MLVYYDDKEKLLNKFGFFDKVWNIYSSLENLGRHILHSIFFVKESGSEFESKFLMCHLRWNSYFGKSLPSKSNFHSNHLNRFKVEIKKKEPKPPARNSIKAGNDCNLNSIRLLISQCPNFGLRIYHAESIIADHAHLMEFRCSIFIWMLGNGIAKRGIFSYYWDSVIWQLSLPVEW